VVLRQDRTDSAVHGEVHGEADVALVERQVARILSLDHDAGPYEAIGERDPVIGRLQAIRPGLRPPLFHSPYEAAVWAILSTRRPAAVATKARDALARAHGRVFELEGRELAALPTPDQLLRVETAEGVPQDRIARLHGVADFAREGGLDADRLLAMGPERATESVQQITGIGPFYASLIVIRGTGFADVLVDREPRLQALVQRLYGLEQPPEPAELARIAEAWRPMRTWAAVLVRAAGNALV
jgi:DNA-3-methyladenine glycosylase II